jgi:hypothetical protein
MASLYIGGKLSSVTIPEKTPLSAFLKKHGLLTVAAQRGIECRYGDHWKSVPIYYVPKSSDTLRIRIPTTHTTAHPMATLIQEIVRETVSRKSGNRISRSSDK